MGPDAKAVAFYCAAVPTKREGEATWMASAGRSYYWHPDEWRLEGRRSKLPEWLDPLRLFRRADWLLQIQLGIDVGDDGLRRAAPLSAWKAERRLLAKHPHLAAYWLWSHFHFDRESELKEALASTSSVSHPIVKAARRRILSGKEPRPLRREPPPGGLDGLKPAAEKDVELKKALVAFETLERRGKKLWTSCSMELYGLLNDFVGRVDARWREVVERRLKARSRMPGLILAWGKLAADLKEFTKVAGPSGGDEFYRALARFPDATPLLAKDAARWVKKADLWERAGSSVAFEVLLGRDTPDTRRLVATLLRTSKMNGSSYDECLEAVEAAARWRIRAAIPGLRRAAKGLGKLGPAARKALKAMKA